MGLRLFVLVRNNSLDLQTKLILSPSGNGETADVIRGGITARQFALERFKLCQTESTFLVTSLDALMA